MLVGFSGSVDITPTSALVTVNTDLGGFSAGVASGTVTLSAAAADLPVSTELILSNHIFQKTIRIVVFAGNTNPPVITDRTTHA